MTKPNAGKIVNKIGFICLLNTMLQELFKLSDINS